MTSDRTKECKEKRNIYYLLSLLLWLGTASFMVFGGLKIGLATNTSETSETSKYVTYLLSLSVSLIIAIMLTIIIKDKVRNTIWMASVIIAAIVYKETGMYITFALWAIDEYILYMLYKRYKLKVEINKEMDRR